MKKMRMHWSLVVLASAGTMSAAATSPLGITPNQMVTATVSIGHRATIGVTGGARHIAGGLLLAACRRTKPR